MNKFIGILFFILISINPSLAQTQILWEENFNDNIRGWTLGDKEEYETKMSDGYFEILHKRLSGSYYFTVESQTDPSMDFYIETKLVHIDGVNNYGYGLILKDERKSKQFIEYYFTISANGSFTIFSYNMANNETLTYRDWRRNESIKTEIGAENLLAIRKAGSTTFFYINGELVSKLNNTTFWGTWVGFIVYSNQSIKADYIKVQQDRGKINLVDGYDRKYNKENLGPGINSANREIMPVVSPDEKILYIDVKDDPQNIGDEEKEKDDIWYSTKNADGSWSPRKNIGPPINNKSHNFVISALTDSTLLLSGQYNSKGEWLRDGLSISQKTADGWEIPTHLKIQQYYINDNFTAFCLSPDKKTLVMTIERLDSFGDLDLYVSFLNDNGKWTAPKNMGSVLNTYGYDVAPFIAADGKTLYYSTNGKLGYGDNDIFVSQRMDDTWLNWSEPKNLGPNVNTRGWDAYFTIAHSGKYAFMVSTYNTLGEEDIFSIKLTE